MNEQKKTLLKEADLLKAAGQIFSKWKFVAVVTVCFALLGVIIAVSTVKSYTSEVVVAPEASSSSFSSSGLGSLASMVGVDLSMAEGDDALYPLLYPDIVRSLPFAVSLFQVNVKTLDESVDTTFYSYYKNFQKRTWLDGVKDAPKMAIAWVRKLFSSKDGNRAGSADFNPYNLSEEQTIMVDRLNGAIDIFVDKKTNVITISFTDRDPRVAAIMAETIMERLQKEITGYRTKKSVDDCNYIEKMYLEAKDSLEVSQKRYASFLDRNRNVTNEHVLVEKERLESDKNLKTTLYTQWAQQLQLARAKVQEKTPVFVTLKPAVIPAQASSMGRAAMVVMYAFIGFVIAVARVLLKGKMSLLWLKIKRKED
ncbi:MAG: hypothetical protein IKJ95_01055 [Bacteroidaceae bacterium]|nr:hypothetical protein [Bacteroidaceae bacterium]